MECCRVREFLSEEGVQFEDRNVAKSGAWRQELIARRGEVVVPVLFVGDEEIVGFDEPRIRRALGLPPGGAPPPWEGLVDVDIAPPAATEDTLRGDVTHLVAWLQKEMEFNASKGSSAYREGQHDGMRYARDALRRILAGTYERLDMIVERPPADEGQP
jgi:glutaredoxin 3